MNGRTVVGGIVLTALLMAAGAWYTAEYAYYREVAPTEPAAAMHIQPVTGGAGEPMIVSDFQGIDADSSPLKFRACFITPMTVAMLTESYRIYEKPTPLFAPRWFSCFDAQAIGKDLETGKAVAILSDENIKPGVDRVVAVYPDGRAYAWQQLNESADNQQGSAP
jgi:hypothetical protein